MVQGVKIYVADTGVDPSHPDFRDGQVGDGHAMPAGHGEVTDCNGHGTLIAGIAAGQVRGLPGCTWRQASILGFLSRLRTWELGGGFVV